MKKLKTILMITIIICLMLILSTQISFAEEADYKVNLSDLTYTSNGTTAELTIYKQDDFNTFVSAYETGNLPEVYVTEFLFDGVSMVKTPDLDDFIDEGNETKIKTLGITAININRTGNTEITGELTGGMIAVNTNGVTGEINIILNGVKLDTDSKKAPAIYVYNKDITSTDCKVTIKTVSGSKNYIEGGKFKKVSLVGTDELSNYTSKYSGESQTWYNTYTNYYGIYTAEQINNILFAKVQADSEDLADGDPYYFYKGAGAISSDIDLYFEGTGYLEVTSKNKEGIETKGNLTFSGGTGDYIIYAEDDCLNTTTKTSAGQNMRNALTIDVNSLVAIVDAGEDADEGDAIDSNGTLTINGGTIVAIAHPGPDAGIDSENGISINGGTVFATGDMYDAISNQSTQNSIVLRFQNKPTEGTVIALLDSKDNIVMAYKTDRAYTNLVYSSESLKEGTYYLYKDGTIEGTETNGFYTNITNYTKGTQLGYASTGIQGNMGGQRLEGNNQGEPPEMSQGEMNGETPQMPNVNVVQEARPTNNENTMSEPPTRENEKNMQNSNATSSNKEFIITSGINQFSGIADYTATSENTQIQQTKETNTIISNINIIIAILGAMIFILILVIIILIIKDRKKV